uniref:(northern house mosquito) hypothetical protein n=1 Tax=Culex pipiens TaxID=7175 RepID=A0A8D8CDV0_CULPI
MHAQVAGAVDQLLRAGARRDGVRDRAVQGSAVRAEGGGGNDEEHSPDLQHQSADDQARADEGRQAAGRELGAILAAVPVEEHDQAEEAQGCGGQEAEEGQEGPHAVPAAAAREQSGQGVGLGRVLPHGGAEEGEAEPGAQG